MAYSDIVSSVGQIGSAIPYVGGAISGIASLASGIMKSNEAKDQAARAQQLRQQSANTQKMALRPEYLKTLHMQQMAALAGLPGYQQYLNNIDSGVADSARAIRESSPSGAATLNTISAVLGRANDAKQQLFIQDAANREAKNAQVANTLWNTGDKQMDLVGLQRADKAALNQGAMNLENAATANRVGASDQILSTVGALGSLAGKAIDGKDPNAIRLQDGTEVSGQTVAAILAALKKTGGVLPQ